MRHPTTAHPETGAPRWRCDWVQTHKAMRLPEQVLSKSSEPTATRAVAEIWLALARNVPQIWSRKNFLESARQKLGLQSRPVSLRFDLRFGSERSSVW